MALKRKKNPHLCNRNKQCLQAYLRLELCQNSCIGLDIPECICYGNPDCGVPGICSNFSITCSQYGINFNKTMFFWSMSACGITQECVLHFKFAHYSVTNYLLNLDKILSFFVRSFWIYRKDALTMKGSIHFSSCQEDLPCHLPCLLFFLLVCFKKKCRKVFLTWKKQKSKLKTFVLSEFAWYASEAELAIPNVVSVPYNAHIVLQSSMC